MAVSKVTETFSFCPQIMIDDIEDIKADGFTVILNHRPDGEQAGQPTSAALAAEAKTCGIAYHHIPFSPGRATQADVDRVSEILASAKGPTLGFCKSGMRAKGIHAMANRGAVPSASATGFFSKLFKGS